MGACYRPPIRFRAGGEISGKGFRIGELGMRAEKLQLAGGMSGGELVEEQSSEQARQHAHQEEKVRTMGATCVRWVPSLTPALLPLCVFGFGRGKEAHC
jgi:hypothetical protein